MGTSSEVSLAHHRDIFHYYVSLKTFFEVTGENRDRSNSTRAQKARAKLLKLSSSQFYELSTDVSDELQRRIGEDANQPDYLLPKANFHMKRNQARQKLANLSQTRFNDLLDDILFEIKRRGFDEDLDAPPPPPPPPPPLQPMKQEVDKDSDDFARASTNSSSVAQVAPNVTVQPSLVIPKMASIDWSSEEEEENVTKAKPSRSEEKTPSTDGKKEAKPALDPIVTDATVSDSQVLARDITSMARTPTTTHKNYWDVNDSPIIKVDNDIDNDKILEQLRSPEAQRPEDDKSGSDMKEKVKELTGLNSDLHSEIKNLNAKLAYLTSEKEKEKEKDLKNSHTIDESFQKELLSLNAQIGELSIENENLKQKVSEFEIHQKKSGNHDDIKITDAFISKYSSVDGLIPVQYILNANNLITHFTTRLSTVPTGDSAAISHQIGKELFQILSQLASLISQLLLLADLLQYKDQVILLKASLSHAITSIRYFSVYGPVLVPKITVQAAISEISFAICNLVDSAKIKLDSNSSGTTANEVDRQTLEYSPSTITTPMTPTFPSTSSAINMKKGFVNPRESASFLNDVEEEESPVKPLKITQKAINSPIIRPSSSGGAPTTSRKPSGTGLFSLMIDSSIAKNNSHKDDKDKYVSPIKPATSTADSVNNNISEIPKLMLPPQGEISIAIPSSENQIPNIKIEHTEENNRNLVGNDTSSVRNNKSTEENNKSTEENDKSSVGNNTSSVGNNKSTEMNDKSSVGNNTSSVGNNRSTEENNRSTEENNRSTEENNRSTEENNKSTEENVNSTEMNDRSSVGNNKSTEGNEKSKEKTGETPAISTSSIADKLKQFEQNSEKKNSIKENSIPNEQVKSKSKISNKFISSINDMSTDDDLSSDGSGNNNLDDDDDFTYMALKQTMKREGLKNEKKIENKLPANIIELDLNESPESVKIESPESIKKTASSKMSPEMIRKTASPEIVKSVLSPEMRKKLSSKKFTKNIDSSDMIKNVTSPESVEKNKPLELAGKVDSSSMIDKIKSLNRTGKTVTTEAVESPEETRESTSPLVGKIESTMTINGKGSLEVANNAIPPRIKMKAKLTNENEKTSHLDPLENSEPQEIVRSIPSLETIKKIEPQEITRSALSPEAIKKIEPQEITKDISSPEAIKETKSQNMLKKIVFPKSIMKTEPTELARKALFSATPEKNEFPEMKSYNLSPEALKNSPPGSIEKTVELPGNNKSHIDTTKSMEPADMNTKDRELNNFRADVNLNPTIKQEEENGDFSRINYNTENVAAKIEVDKHHFNKMSDNDKSKSISQVHTSQKDSDESPDNYRRKSNAQLHTAEEQHGPIKPIENLQTNKANRLPISNSKLVNDGYLKLDSSAPNDVKMKNTAETMVHDEKHYSDDDDSSYQFIPMKHEEQEEEQGARYWSEQEEESEDDDDEEEDSDFDVDTFDIENPDNTLSELLLYLEHQTMDVISTIQSLLTSIKKPQVTKGNLRGESNAINQVIGQMVDATSISMEQSRNANLKKHGDWVVQSLRDCSRRMTILCQLTNDGVLAKDKSDQDYADKNFKQRLAGIAFDVAKCTKELVKTVEEASLKDEINYLNAKLK